MTNRGPALSFVAHRASGVIHTWLEDEGLRIRWEKTGEERLVRFADIRSIHLRSRHPAYGTWLTVARGGPVRLSSRNWPGTADAGDHAEEYSALVRALIVRTAEANPSVQLVAGSGLSFLTGCVLTGLSVALGTIALFAFSRGGIAHPLRLVVVPLMLVAGLALLARGRGRRFAASELPPELLPGS